MKKIIEGKRNLLISIVLYCLSISIFLIKQNNQTTTSDFPCNFNFTVSNMNRFNQGIDHG